MFLFVSNLPLYSPVNVRRKATILSTSGVQHDYFADRQAEMTEEDNGRFKQTKAERDRHRFKVPGLRNIELTAPYFHDGSMATMDDAVRAMAKYQLGIDLPQPEVDKIVLRGFLPHDKSHSHIS